MSIHTMGNHPKQSRRNFLRNAVCTVAAGGVGAFVPKLNLIGTALAQGTLPGYKALVCLYLDGGNDSWNLMIPTEAARHADYVAARGGLYGVTGGALGIPRPGGTAPGSLPAALALNGGQYGVNPFAPELQQLYNNGRLAFVANVGTLADPITRATYNARRKPPQLYSHNDQTVLWQMGNSDSLQGQNGFGGQIAGYTAAPNLLNLPPAISISGRTRFLVGETLANGPISPFQLTDGNTPATTLSNYGQYNGGNPTGDLNRFEPQRMNTLLQLFAEAYPQQFSAEHKEVFNRSLELADTVNSQIATNGTLTTTFPNTSLGRQLRQVARMIKISRPGGAISANRQVFFVRTGGFDTHDNQITSATAAQGHHGLLQQISQAVNAFNNAMTEIGATNEVVLFSQSDFARTINSNGNGTDHAWGSLQFLMGGPAGGGGPLNGGQVYGRYPTVKLDNRIGGTGAVLPENGECFNRGQFLPTTAIDQVAATLARWMGVTDTQLPEIFPNIDRFATGPFANAAATPTFASFGRTLPFLNVA